jgi:1-acyl-sn-glycerol-3-phosphate acyltransferase
LPIVPVGIEGSLAIQPKGSLTIRPGRVTLRYGRPLDVVAYGVRRREELADEVARRIAELARCERAEGSASVG